MSKIRVISSYLLVKLSKINEIPYDKLYNIRSTVKNICGESIHLRTYLMDF